MLVRLWISSSFFSSKSKTYFTVCSKVNFMKINFAFCRLLLLLRYHIKHLVSCIHIWATFCTKLCVVLTVWSAEMQTFLRKLTIVRLSWFYDFLTCLSVQLNTVKQLTVRAGIFVQIWIRKNDNVDILMSHLLLCCLSCKYLLLQYFIFCLVVYFVVTLI